MKSIASALLLAATLVPSAASAAIAYVSEAVPALAAGAVVVDARPLADCRGESLEGARCLPAADLMGPHRRLLDFREILWLLGANGLDGSEHVLVIGGEATARDFVAGVLHLAGQRRISILTRAWRASEPKAPGVTRSLTREKVFQAPLRDRLVVLRDELAQAIAARTPPLILDGRSEAEYWGATIRALRGGHVPGAEHLAASALRGEIATGRASVPAAPTPVAYGHDAFEGIAYFTVLTAGVGVEARIFIGGWAEWAAATALPADAVTYADRGASAAAEAARAAAIAPLAWPWLALGLLLGAGVAAGGFYLGRRRAS